MPIPNCGMSRSQVAVGEFLLGVVMAAVGGYPLTNLNVSPAATMHGGE